MFLLSLHHITQYDPTTTILNQLLLGANRHDNVFVFYSRLPVKDIGNVLPTTLSIFSLPKNLLALFRAGSVCVLTRYVTMFCFVFFFFLAATTYKRIEMVR